MPDDQNIGRSELLALTAEIVAAHVGNNAITGSEVGGARGSHFEQALGRMRLCSDEVTRIDLTQRTSFGALTNTKQR